MIKTWMTTKFKYDTTFKYGSSIENITHYGKQFI